MGGALERIWPNPLTPHLRPGTSGGDLTQEQMSELLENFPPLLRPKAMQEKDLAFKSLALPFTSAEPQFLHL